MRALLVYPEIPATFWGYQRSLAVIRKRASLPPLGLVTLAALLPPSWELRLVDLNLAPLDDRDLRWADVVLVSGMLLQAQAMLAVVGRAHARGRVVVVGGPAATTAPELFRAADIVFRGEAEGRVGELEKAVETGRSAGVTLAPPSEYPDLAGAPAPRFALLDLAAYASMSVQFSRGCPYSCEFCDVIEIFGRTPRVKSPGQVLAELDALFALGWRGSLFFVDDNFVGNRRAVRRLLPELERWQRGHGYPFDLFTEASIDLAAEPELVAAMVRAGFSSVFVGIESPSRAALEHSGKRHNLRVDPTAAVMALTRAGLEVMAGLIVGFDTDKEEIFERQRAFVASLPMPVAMAGVLNAPPGTALWRRLEREGRLRSHGNGDQFDRPNFRPAMDEAILLRGYAGLLRRLYAPAAYYRRCRELLDSLGDSTAVARSVGGDTLAFLRAVLLVGVLGRHRRHFWRLLRRGLRRGFAGLRKAVVLAVKGEHLIGYTESDVVPRIEQALDEIARERRTASADAQDDLAEVGRGRHQPVALGSLLERQHAVDHRAQAVCGEELSEAVEESRHEAGLLVERAGPQRRAEDRKPAREQLAQVDLGGATAHESDHDQPAAGGERCEVALEVWRADRVENHVDTTAASRLPRRCHEVAAAIVDRGVGAEAEAAHALVVGASGDDHHPADRLDQDDRGGAYAAAAAVDQHTAAGAQTGEAKHRKEHRQERLRESGSFLEWHQLGDGHHAAGGDHHLLGVAAAGEQRHRPIARLPAAHPGARLHHLAGALESEDLGGAGRGRVLALALQQVGAVEGGGKHAQAQLAAAESRRHDLAEPQDALVAGLVEDDRLHREERITGSKDSALVSGDGAGDDGGGE